MNVIVKTIAISPKYEQLVAAVKGAEKVKEKAIRITVAPVCTSIKH